MIYLSKGLVCKGSTEELLDITHHGQHFTLTRQLSGLWLNGRYGFFAVKTQQERHILYQLARMGLAEYEEEETEVSKYRILARCILCPTTNEIRPWQMLKRTEKTALIWLQKAGLRLSTAELVYLLDNEILPEAHLLYEGNRQALVERLYTADTIMDGILETRMEHAKKRDEVVGVILELIRKKKVVVL